MKRIQTMLDDKTIEKLESFANKQGFLRAGEPNISKAIREIVDHVIPDRYNGWYSWETWACHLNLSNDETSHRKCAGKTAKQIAQYWMQTGGVHPAQFTVRHPDRLDIDNNKIDWQEISDAFSNYDQSEGS